VVKEDIAVLAGDLKVKDIQCLNFYVI